MTSPSYEFDATWPKNAADLPAKCAAVAAHRNGDVFAFFRDADRPVVVIGSDGAASVAWRENHFTRPHGASFGLDGHFYLTDDAASSVRKFSSDGDPLLELKPSANGAAFMSGTPFARCTNAVATENGTIFVSDGYGNARVHCFRSDGRLIRSWGAPGTDPGQFNIAHHIALLRSGNLAVADRENHRVQVFDQDGNLLSIWNNLHRPTAVAELPNDLLAVTELGPALDINVRIPNLGPRISIVDHDGRVISRIPGSADEYVLTTPHGVAADGSGNIYVADLKSDAKSSAALASTTRFQPSVFRFRPASRA